MTKLLLIFSILFLLVLHSSAVYSQQKMIVKVSPSNAKIFQDGVLIGFNYLEITLAKNVPSTLIEVKLDGYVTIRQEIDEALFKQYKNNTYLIKLTERLLTVESIPQDARLSYVIDGLAHIAVEKLSPFIIRFPANTNNLNLILEKEGFITKSKSLSEDATFPLSTKMELDEKEVMINVEPNNINAEIWIDGNQTDTYNEAKIIVKKDKKVKVEARAKGYEYESILLNFNMQQINQTIYLKNRVIKLIVMPKDAQIYIDGKLSKQTNNDLTIPFNSAIEVVVQKEGYEQQSFTLWNQDDKPALNPTKRIELKPLVKSEPKLDVSYNNRDIDSAAVLQDKIKKQAAINVREKIIADSISTQKRMIEQKRKKILEDSLKQEELKQKEKVIIGKRMNDSITSAKIAQKQITEQQRKKQVADSIVSAKAEAKLQLAIKVEEKRINDSIASVKAAQKKLEEEKRKKQIADSIVTAKAEVKLQLAIKAEEKRINDSITSAKALQKKLEQQQRKQFLADSLKKEQLKQAMIKAEEKRINDSINYEKVYKEQLEVVWRRDTTFTAICHLEEEEFIYKFYPTQPNFKAFELSISYRKGESLTIVYLCDIKILSNTPEQIRITLAYATKNSRGGWVSYKQSYLEVLYDNINHNVLFTPYEKMIQAKSDKAPLSEPLSQKFNLRDAIVHSTDYFILHYSSVFIK